MEFAGKFRQLFFDLDATFMMHGNDFELRVLSGAVLAHQFSEAGSSAVLSPALAAVCCYCQGAVSDVVIPDVVARAKRVLLTHSRKYRTLVVRKDTTKDDEAARLVQKITQTAEANDVKATAAAVADALRQLSGAVRTGAISHNALAEEMNMLWWVFGEYSSLLDRSYRDCDASIATLISAKELADLTISPTGSLSADAILNRALSTTREHSKSIVLKAVFDTHSLQQRKTLLGDYGQSPVIDLCPIHFALDQTEKLGSSQDAIKNTSALLAIKLGQALRPVEWASQFYRECLLLRSIGK